jgi:hypothetical protein
MVVRPMSREPFHPPAVEARRRRRRRLLPALAGVAVVLAGAGFVVSEYPFEPEQAELKRAGFAKAADRMRDGKKAGVEGVTSAPVLLGVRRSTLESIAECESHGDPRAKSSDGTYRGKYQFDRQTWSSVGGKGDPAKAPEFEQDVRAAALYKRSSSSPWPVCG